MAKYLPRVADETLKEYLEAFGAVLIEGPKLVWENNHRRTTSQKRNKVAVS